jgi:hypothetical protein
MARIPDEEGKRAALYALAMILGLALLLASGLLYAGAAGFQ